MSSVSRKFQFMHLRRNAAYALACAAILLFSACGDDTKSTPAPNPCDGIDCGGHGTCSVDASNAPKCTCEASFHNSSTNALICEANDPGNPCSGIDCGGHGTCSVDASNAPKCTCEASFHNSSTNALLCEANDPGDPCSGIDCSGHGTCKADANNQPVCDCESGYIPADVNQCISIDSNRNLMKDTEETSPDQGKDCAEHHNADCANAFCDSFIGYKCSTQCTSDSQCIGDEYFCRADGRCAPRVFETVWHVDNTGIELLFPCGDSASANYTIDWGDGNQETFETCEAGTNAHAYTEAGDYHIKVTGKLSAWKCTENTCTSNEANPNALTEIASFGPVNLDSNGAFLDANRLTKVSAIDIPNLSQTESLKSMFAGASRFNHSIENWDISHITTLENMFAEAAEFNQPLEKWDTSAVTNMRFMFFNTQSFNQPLEKWDTSHVTDMDGMFSTTGAFNQPLEKWDTSSVTTMESMFDSAAAFDQPLEKWNTASVTKMTGMFSNTKVFNQPLGKWDTSSVTTMENMFSEAQAFNQTLNGWKTSEVDNMAYMFNEAAAFNQPLDEWDTSKLQHAEYMFSDAASFNQPLNAWKTPKLRHIESMFMGASAFDQPLDKWDVSRVSDFEHYAGAFENSGLSKDNWIIMKTNNEGWRGMGAAALGLPADYDH